MTDEEAATFRRFTLLMLHRKGLKWEEGLVTDDDGYVCWRLTGSILTRDRVIHITRGLGAAAKYAFAREEVAREAVTAIVEGLEEALLSGDELRGADSDLSDREIFYSLPPTIRAMM